MDDLDSIASLTRQIEGVQIGITLTEKPDGTVRVSVRTTKEMDAAAICKKVGGGGHIRAAGASFTCGMAEAKAAMLKAAEEQLSLIHIYPMVGDIIDIDIPTKSFGRIAAQTAKQVIIQGIREARCV